MDQDLNVTVTGIGLPNEIFVHLVDSMYWRSPEQLQSVLDHYESHHHLACSSNDSVPAPSSRHKLPVLRRDAKSAEEGDDNDGELNQDSNPVLSEEKLKEGYVEHEDRASIPHIPPIPSSSSVESCFSSSSHSSIGEFDKDELGEFGDIYSYGMLLYELITGKLPYKKKTGGAIEPRRLVEDIVRLHWRPSFPPNIDEKFYGVSRLVDNCLHKDPRYYIHRCIDTYRYKIEDRRTK